MPVPHSSTHFLVLGSSLLSTIEASLCRPGPQPTLTDIVCVASYQVNGTAFSVQGTPLVHLLLQPRHRCLGVCA